MAKKPTQAAREDAAREAEWDGTWDGTWDAAAEAAPAEPAPDAPAPGERHLDTVAQVLAALPAGEAGRTLKLALLDALEAGARADRLTLPVELRGLRARLRAGTA